MYKFCCICKSKIKKNKGISIRNLNYKFLIVCSNKCYKKSIINRFYERVNRFSRFGKNGDCWKWLGTCNYSGYGVIGLNKKVIKAHRFSWMIHNNNFKISSQNFICHKCDNPKCVNPKHLFIGTAKDNAVDCKNKGKNNFSLIYKQYKQSLKLLKSTLSNKNLNNRFKIVKFLNNAVWKVS